VNVLLYLVLLSESLHGCGEQVYGLSNLVRLQDIPSLW